MPVVINFNVGVELKIANGTRGTLYAWEFPSGTTFTPHKLFGDSNATVLRASHPVSVVYLGTFESLNSMIKFHQPHFKKFAPYYLKDFL